MVTGKRAFSVPIGKLRNKNSRCRGGSSPGSCSRSRLLNRLLKKNNKELAFALAKQKERNKITTDDNVKLMSTLHDARLEAVGWKNKFLEKQKSLSEYRDSVIVHIKEAVRYSVLLTESLKLAMTIPCAESSSAIGSEPSSQKVSVDRSNNTATPMRLRVNPMVSGHTIMYPTVNLKRLDVEVVERITEENNEEASEDVVEKPSEKSQPSSNAGLSTCIEEDEEGSQIRNVTSTSPQEMHEDSFRRRTVSFRNRTLDKSKQMWQIEVADSTPSKLTVENREALSPLKCNNKRECPPRKYSSDWECVAVPEGLNWLNPVVALYDVSKFLRCSNSVNVLEIAQLSSKILSLARHHDNSPENEKENIISNKIVSEPVKSKRKTKRVMAAKVGSEDPLEGSSWMYQDLFIKPSAYNTEEPSSKKSGKCGNKEIKLNDKKTRKRNRDPESDSFPRKGESKKNFSSNFVEKKDSFSPGKMTKLDDRSNTEQECPLSLDCQRKSSDSLQSNDICCESLNMAQIRNDVRNHLVLQSTPLCRESSSSKKPNASPSSMSPNFGSPDQSHSVPTFVSPKLSKSGAAGENMIDDCSSPLINDAKLLPNAFVTVRVKRLKHIDDSEEEKQLDDNPVIESEIGHVSDSKELDSHGFNGFNCANINIEKAKELRDGIGFLGSCSGITTTESTRTSYEFMGCSNKTEDTGSLDFMDSRPKRRAAPKVLKEPSLNKKLRQDTDGKRKNYRKKTH